MLSLYIYIFFACYKVKKFKREFDNNPPVRYIEYPPMCGSSGISARNLSTVLLKVPNLQLLMFLISGGRALNNCAPKTVKLFSFRVCSDFLALFAKLGTEQKRPFLELKMLEIFFVPSRLSTMGGTKSSRTFQT